MAGESSLIDQVKTLQRHMGLFCKAFRDMTERVKALEENAKVDDRKEIKDDVNKKDEIESILEKQKLIDKAIAANTDAICKIDEELLDMRKRKEFDKDKVAQRKEENEVKEISDKVKNKKIKKCRYYNCGYCKYISKCIYKYHKDVCKEYLENKNCEKHDCCDRHPRHCKWQGSEVGCKRQVECEYLHVTMVDDDDEVNSHKYKCVSCKDTWQNRACIVEHIIQNTKMFFCLNCDEWVKTKSQVLDEGWTLLDEAGNLKYDL